jgi:N-acetylglucosamine-6-phosphate deacetylase
MQAYCATEIFDGEKWITGQAIVVENGKIVSILPEADAGVQVHQNKGYIVPAFIDVQVYGTEGKLFAVYPEAETLALMNESFRKTGTVLFLPTLATNTAEVFKKGIDAVRNYWRSGGKGVYGLHLEGPWINEEKRGAHVKELVRIPRVEDVKDMLDYGKDVIKMITLAPEICSDEMIRLIKFYGIIVSAGHSSASYQQAIHSFDKGIDAVTHLYNAMSPLHHREPGLVGAALKHPRVRASIIPDGHHVDYAAVSIAQKIMGERLFAITDAVTETTEGLYQHQLNGDKYECNGVLSGSALSMHGAFLNLVNHAGVSREEALRMCSLYPARLLGIEKTYGRIAPQFSGEFLLLNEEDCVLIC